MCVAGNVRGVRSGCRVLLLGCPVIEIGLMMGHNLRACLHNPGWSLLSPLEQVCHVIEIMMSVRNCNSVISSFEALNGSKIWQGQLMMKLRLRRKHTLTIREIL